MNLNIDPRLPFGGKTNIEIGYAKELFDAINASGDKPKNEITFEELEGIHPADTFDRFLKVNQMITFDEVSR